MSFPSGDQQVIRGRTLPAQATPTRPFGVPGRAVESEPGATRTGASVTPLLAALGLLAVLTIPSFAQGGRGSSTKAAIDVPVSSTTGVPSAGNSTAPAGIVLVGSKNGVPDPAGLFTVTIRDLTNSPIANLPVHIEFEDAPDLLPGAVQLHPGVTATCSNRVTAFTDAGGVASFIILGSGGGRYSAAGTIGGQVKVRAGASLIATMIGAAYDLDGANGVTAADVAALVCDLGTGLNLARCDYDFSGSIGANDVSILTAIAASGSSSVSATPCPGGPALVPTLLVSGGLSLGWDDCRQLSGVADKSFNCAVNTGSVHLIGSLSSGSELVGVTAIEADIDIVNPAGVLPAWWQLQPGGCRTALSSADPSNNVAITCTIAGAAQATTASVIYPFNGDPNVARVHLTTVLDAAGLLLTNTDQNALLDIVINRSKSTGVGLCAGCEVPVDIALRSLRVVRGDACASAPDTRPQDIVFTQTSGLNVAHWQSVTPSFPIAVDATQRIDPQFRLSVTGCLDGSVVQNFTLVPGQYLFISCAGGQLGFEVDANGKVAYDPSLEGLLTGAGSTTLVVHEPPLVTIDATQAPNWTYQVDGGACFPRGAIQTLRLFPGTHTFAICAGTCPGLATQVIQFEVNGAGQVSYDPLLEGALSGAGTTTLVVKSVTFPPRGDDVTTSMGMFRVVVEPAFWNIMNGYPGFSIFNGVHRLVSPVLFEQSTKIGRSSVHAHGAAADNAGVQVGSAGTIISDTSFVIEPPGFQGPPGTAEVHTEIRSLNMTGGQSLGLVAVRAGTNAPGRPISPGEIEAVPGITGLFPAESFFNVFVEVDLPLIGTLYNASSDPLVVENDGIDCFPPHVVYRHRHTGPVAILFKSDDAQLPKRWLAGQRFGWLVLAGHGIDFDTVTVAPANGAFGRRQVQVDPFAEFTELVNAEPEMADTATLVVDLHDILTFSAPGAFTAAAFRDSLMNGIDLAAALGLAGNPCAALFEATRMHQRVDSLASPSDWVVDQTVRRALADRIFALSAQLLAQANQSGGCTGVLGTPPAVLPTRLALLGIQPNPSFGISTIRYALPTRERVNLSVFDLSGRLVRTLVDAELPAGTYQAVWDGHQDRAGGRRVSSGTYFVRLMARGRMESRRVVIIR